MLAARKDGDACVGFDAVQIAAALGVDVATVVEANKDGTLICLGTAVVPPSHGGRTATEYGFRLGDRQGSLTVEIDQQEGSA